jgi:hypothetical protein
MLFNTPKAQTAELGGKACLCKSQVCHGKAQDVLDGLADHVVELNGLMSPLLKRRGTHEMNRANDAVTYTQ